METKNKESFTEGRPPFDEFASAPTSTLPPITSQLAPLLRCSTFLAFARGAGCEPDVRFLLLSTDYAIFYSAVKQRVQTNGHSPAAQEAQKQTALITQLNTYATAMISSFFTCQDTSTRLFLLRTPLPPPKVFVNIAITKEEIRSIGLHAAAEFLTRNPLPKPAPPPSIFQPSFLLVQSHLTAWLVPRFDIVLIRNTRTRTIPTIICIIALSVAMFIIIYLSWTITPSTEMQNHMTRIASLPFFLIAALAYAQATTRFSALKHMLRILFKNDEKTEWDEKDLNSSVLTPSSSNPSLPSDRRKSTDKRSSFSSAISPMACANCPTLKTRTTAIRNSKTIAHMAYSILFAICFTFICVFLFP